MEYLLDLLKENAGALITLVIGTSAVSGILVKISKVTKEIYELLQSIVEALADNKIDNAEIDKIMKEGKDVFTTIKNLKDIK